MLVLTRRIKESVVVGASKDITEVLKVTVLQIRGGKVRLGFQTRDDVPVHRWEVWARLCANDRPALQ